MKPTKLVVSCEHAVNTVPKPYQALFATQNDVLNTHRGIDIGALEIAEAIHQSIPCDFEKATVSRLLIDCNRSVTHSTCFSSFTRTLPNQDKQTLITAYYEPFRHEVERIIESHIHQGSQVFHLSVHSFTPILKGKQRNAAIGLLYDYTRHGEREVARLWKNLLQQQMPHYRIRMNYPYHGNTDGFTTALRKKHHERDYIGLELEMNQALLQDHQSIKEMIPNITNSLNELLQLL